MANGQIYTAAPNNPNAEAIAIRNNRIVAVGSSDEIEALAGPTTQTVDLKGHFAIPGLNDAHDHSFSNAPIGQQVNLPWEPSWDPVLEVVEKTVKAFPKGTGIMALTGVKVIDDEKTDRFSLEKIAPDPLGGWFVRKLGVTQITGKIHEGDYSVAHFRTLWYVSPKPLRQPVLTLKRGPCHGQRHIRCSALNII